jgi:hypothetical protein
MTVAPAGIAVAVSTVPVLPLLLLSLLPEGRRADHDTLRALDRQGGHGRLRRLGHHGPRLRSVGLLVGGVGLASVTFGRPARVHPVDAPAATTTAVRS